MIFRLTLLRGRGMESGIDGLDGWIGWMDLLVGWCW
jgi:hypothetical protein